MDHRQSNKAEQYAQLLVEARKHKGMTHERAIDLLQDFNYFGGILAAHNAHLHMFPACAPCDEGELLQAR